MASIPAAGPTWFGHPRQLARLFTTEAMERFGYYGMRALLTLYLADHFLFSDTTTTSLYGGFTALVYLTPLVGGLIADRYLGAKRSVKFGAIVMSAGYLTLCFGGDAAKPFATIDGQRYEVTVDRSTRGQAAICHRPRREAGDSRQRRRLGDADPPPMAPSRGPVAKGGFVAGGDRDPVYTMLMLIGLSAVTVGNGFFKPNISTMVGSLYAVGDRRRDAGFTIFYMGINLGSLFSQLLCPLLAVGIPGVWDGLGWWAGFGLAAIGMAVSWTLIQFAGPKMAGVGETPVQTGGDKSLMIYAAAILAIPVMWLLFTNLMNAPPPVAGQGIGGYILGLPILGKVLFFTFLASVIGIPIWAARSGTRAEFEMMVAAIILIVFNVVFWTLFEQAGSSLTLFADRNTDLRLFPTLFPKFSITAGQTQFFNAFFIVVCAPLMAKLWVTLAKRGIEPGIPVKFGFALIGVGAGFLLLVFGTKFAGPDFRVGIWWLAGLYLIHSLAELCISPVGLSMITKLSIARIVGHDDGGVVPVDQLRPVCRRRRRAGRERRDRRRAGDQPQGQPRDLCRGVPDDRADRGGHRAGSARDFPPVEAPDARSRLMRRLPLLLLVAVAACAGKPPVKSASDKPSGPVEVVAIPADPFPSTYRPVPRRHDRHPRRDDLRRGRAQVRPRHGPARERQGRRDRRERGDSGGATVIDAAGRFVTPGIIDIHSHLGDYPSPQVQAVSDGNEATRPNTADVWAEHSVWPQDAGFTRALAGGVTTFHILPGSANLFGGRGVTVKNVLGRTAQDMKFPARSPASRWRAARTPSASTAARVSRPRPAWATSPSTARSGPTPSSTSASGTTIRRRRRRAPPSRPTRRAASSPTTR